jgi:hypothetical protein
MTSRGTVSITFLSSYVTTFRLTGTFYTICLSSYSITFFS